MPAAHRLYRLCALALLGCGTAAGGQSRIENVATLDYRAGGAAHSIDSNRVVTEVARAPIPTTLQILLPRPGYAPGNARCDPGFVPAPVEPAALAGATRATTLDRTMPLFFVLTDPGGNRDPALRERRPVDVDSGAVHLTVNLTETAPDSGIFAGALPAAGSDPGIAACEPVFGRDDGLTLTFRGDDRSAPATAAILNDPAGFVFDSRSAALINGAEVTLLDAMGRPATVFGDDGVSAYPATVVTGASVTDAAGRSYPGRPGRYRFPLSAPGRYTLRIVPPSDYTAPSTVSRAELATLRAPDGRPFIITDTSFGASLTLTATAPFEADIPLDRVTGSALLVTKTASAREASPGDTIQYRITAANRGSVPATGLHLFDTLPSGLKYQTGSARGVSEPVVSANGRDLDFTVAPLGVGATAEVRYTVAVAPGAPVGEATNRVSIRGGANAGNEAAAAVRIRPLLFTDALTVIGRVSEGNCNDPARRRRGIPGVRLLLEDGTYVVTDRDGLYHLEGIRPGRHVVQLDVASIPASHEAVACDADTRQAGSAISRFVEGDGGLIKRVDFQLRPTGRRAATTATVPIAVADDAAAAGNRDWRAGQTPGVDWLFPAVGHNPRSAALRVVIKHLPSQRVALAVNGRRTEPLAFDGTDGAGDVAVSTWTGLPLVEGDNRLTARILDAGGATVTTLERIVHYAGPAVRATLDPATSRLVADGLTRPLVAVRVTDAAGRPARSGTLVPFKVDQPYTAAIESDLQQARQLAGLERADSTARVVGDDGYAFLALQPTTQAGAVHVTVSLAEDRQVRTTELRTWLAAGRQDWIVVGFGAGTLGYDTLSRNHAALPAGADRGIAAGGQLALYAKGRVKGSWLLTIAYDSGRRRDPDRGLLGTIDPDRYYTVYGDGTQQGYDAPTRRKLYLRLERREFYALFGDFETGLTDTRLGRYSRTLNGAKAAYEGRRLRATGFVAKTAQRYARDEIQGNGLSGPYRLTTRGIVPNSDQVRLEVRDRYRSERTVSSTQLTRHIDYDIDSDLGTLRFREPVLSRDAALNPVFIVIDYEVGGIGAQRLAVGGRAAVRVGGVEVGATALRDDTITHATVIAADLQAALGTATTLRGGIAVGGRGGLGAGTAWLAEVEHHGRRIDGTLYARQQDDGFGLGQQNLVEAGTRKVGVDGRIVLTDRLGITATGWYQQNLAAPGTRIAGEARLEYTRAAGTVYAGVQLARDRGLDRDRGSALLTLGGSQTLFDGMLTLTGLTQFAPGGAHDSVDFPVRHQLTASARVASGVRLIGGYEIAEGDGYTARTAQLGFDVAPWTGAKLTSTVDQQAVGENGARTYAQYGLAQSLTLGRHWSVDATVDSTTTLNGRIPTGAILNAFQPVASGGFVGQTQGQTNGDFTAVTLGGTYRAGSWSWNGRVEYRDGDDNRRWGLTSNFLRTLGEGRTLAASLRGYRVASGSGGIARYGAADVALAWRPLDGNWSILERLSIRHEAAGTGFTAANVLGIPALDYGQQDTIRVINNLALDYRTGPEGRGHGIEATVYHGIKYVKGRLADEKYDGLIDLVGFDLRRDLGARFDIGVQGSVQHAWSAHALSFSGGPSAGVSPAANVWISAGYNIAGYRDHDAEADRYTRRGPYITMRLKFDQSTLRGLIP